jgi:hypothetical protein
MKKVNACARVDRVVTATGATRNDILLKSPLSLLAKSSSVSPGLSSTVPWPRQWIFVFSNLLHALHNAERLEARETELASRIRIHTLLLPLQEDDGAEEDRKLSRAAERVASS